MKRLLKRLENIFVSIAFAEAGEHSNAVEFLKESGGQEVKQAEDNSTLYPSISLIPKEE
ncbi:MAG: hypothetical protein Q8K51_17715 [Nitrospirota bacterium]|nr:hypothetical protein [Nitrospirota bacterium]